MKRIIIANWFWYPVSYSIGYILVIFLVYDRYFFVYLEYEWNCRVEYEHSQWKAEKWKCLKIRRTKPHIKHHRPNKIFVNIIYNFFFIFRERERECIQHQQSNERLGAHHALWCFCRCMLRNQQNNIQMIILTDSKVNLWNFCSNLLLELNWHFIWLKLICYKQFTIEKGYIWTALMIAPKTPSIAITSVLSPFLTKYSCIFQENTSTIYFQWSTLFI